MEDYGEEFPGFQTCVHKEEMEYRRPLSRLQRRAPCQLQIKPANNAPLEWKSDPKISSASAGTSSLDSFYRSKDPIPSPFSSCLAFLDRVFLHSTGKSSKVSLKM
ncbi:hypothetical protein OIU79_006471 [Salix purpurea]|uniref:Uncharacterized protein n=1 Tax=Salix purpurea TaxID=77065 RepID=A0A9Q0TVP0_SALPP|nr:hypothetical protein OIU79_006471 [Salix purpurea]